ncbi:MAG: hypothetical protein HYR72_16890 [Deltaproteobacteria bacterium]|nr:hypothetical protein [Deltaproteobacteria bacterium]MBI3389857.1 hypothetical protein [Deltaproteobacteria bacterium]
MRIEPLSKGAALYCDNFIGHYGSVTLEGFVTAEQAATAFGSIKPADVEVGGGLLRVGSSVPACCANLGGLQQYWDWLRGCWLAGGSAFDDTSYRLAPQPRDVVDQLLRSSHAADLFARCAPG